MEREQQAQRNQEPIQKPQRIPIPRHRSPMPAMQFFRHIINTSHRAYAPFPGTIPDQGRFCVSKTKNTPRAKAREYLSVSKNSLMCQTMQYHRMGFPLFFAAKLKYP